MTVAMLLENTVLSGKRYLSGFKLPMEYLPLQLLRPIPRDIDIASAQTPKPIERVVKELGLFNGEYDLYGQYKAKIHLSVLDRLRGRQNGNYIVVAGITPTPLGEGKSTTTIGLCQALGAHLKKTAFACVRYVQHSSFMFSSSCSLFSQFQPTKSRTNVWDQRRCGWWRVFSSYSNGRI
jgi:methylenetetrahydrofolate dehydrogenase (NADP+)/methenyltetrahydrofolate cyclohydrolase/formyltetrahydrofolate synthetase